MVTWISVWNWTHLVSDHFICRLVNIRWSSPKLNKIVWILNCPKIQTYYHLNPRIWVLSKICTVHWLTRSLYEYRTTLVFTFTPSWALRPEFQFLCFQYLSVDLTAADAGRAVDTVTPVGTEVIYNACFISGDKVVPYLATRLVFPDFFKFCNTWWR